VFEFGIETSALTNIISRYSMYSWDSERDACYIKRRDAVQEGNTMITHDDLLKEMIPNKGLEGILVNCDSHPWLVPVEMPETKLKAFDKQFPWAKDYINGPIAQVYVQGIEPELIDRRLSEIQTKRIFVDSFGPGIELKDHLRERVFLLDKNFKLVTNSRTETCLVRKRSFLGIRFGSKIPVPRIVEFDGTKTFSINSAIEELGEKGESVEIILSYWEYTQAVIIYKLPKGENLKDLVASLAKAERLSFEKSFNSY
jgi:hypothetical protein